MPELIIEYVENALGRRAYLLTERSRGRIKANITAGRKLITQYDDDGLDEQLANVTAQVKALESEIATDDELRFAAIPPAGKIETLTVVHREPTVEDARAVEDSEKPVREAWKRLEPKLDDGSAIPVAILPILDEEMFLLCRPNLSEDRALFTICSPGA